MASGWIKKLFASAASPPAELDGQPIEEGDYRSGPHGYSPMTPYVESQYGSRFDEGADWNDDED